MGQCPCLQKTLIHTVCGVVPVAAAAGVCAGLPALCWDLFCVVAASGFLSERLQHCWSPAFSWLQKGFLGTGVELNIIALVDVLTPPVSEACGFYAEKTEAS